METSMARRRKRTRTAAAASNTMTAPLQCHVVDEHCNALKHIHAAIRRGALPFTGLRMMHWDAHPDLMVTPYMPATTCFQPHDLYDALDEAEGGIAEWILPMVFQGHLEKLWWIRPPWAHQFVDGNHRFCVGQVEATGHLRVSSTAPYFVDDRLHCPEKDMKNCKPLHLHVSLVPPDEDSPRRGDQPSTGTTEVERAPSLEDAAGFTEPALCSAAQHVDAPRTTCNAGVSIAVEGTAEGDVERIQEEERPTMSDGRLASPWVLDICLDYFTTENPFLAELEALIGAEDSALVRAFYEKPRFRGAATVLPHDVQIEHERIFKTEVDKLLGLEADGADSDLTAAGAVTENGVVQGRTSPSPPKSIVTERVSSAAQNVGSSSASREKQRGVVAEANEAEKKRQEDAEKKRGLQRLTDLFSPNEQDRLLVRRFASLVDRIGPKGRDMVAWTDHCACLPRYSATREEVSAAVRRAERLLRSVTGTVGKCWGEWTGRPGLVTVARSEGDGYVPAEMCAFVEVEVLGMLRRLYDDGGGKTECGSGLDVLYDEGLESKYDQK